MKLLFASASLICLLLGSNTVSAFERLSLTDKEGSRSISTQHARSNQFVEPTDFQDAAQKKITFSKKLSGNQLIKFEGLVQYLGDDMRTLIHFTDFMNRCLESYHPDMDLSQKKEIVISETDTIKARNAAQFIVDNLFSLSIPYNFGTNNKFKEFKESNEKPFGYHSFEKNSILFSLLYYITKETEPFELKGCDKKYNGLIFKFLPYIGDTEEGQKMNFSFDKKDFTFSTKPTLYTDSPAQNTLKHSLHTSSSFYDALYEFALYKLEAKDSYRLEIKLSSKENNYSKEYYTRQISNILLQINS